MVKPHRIEVDELEELGFTPGPLRGWEHWTPWGQGRLDAWSQEGSPSASQAQACLGLSWRWQGASGVVSGP